MRRLSFSLRDVFWLTLLAGMGTAWLIDHQQVAHQLEAACVFLRECGGIAEYYEGRLIVGDRHGNWHIADRIGVAESERIFKAKGTEFEKRAAKLRAVSEGAVHASRVEGSEKRVFEPAVNHGETDSNP